MKFQELQSKPKTELEKMLKENIEFLRVLRFKVTQKQLKNIRELRTLKKENARILTAMNLKSTTKHKNMKA